MAYGALVSLRKRKKTLKRVRPAGRDVERGENCVVGNDQGRMELALFLREGVEIQDSDWKIIRSARDGDIEKFERNKDKAEKALEKARELVEKQGLSMDLMGGDYSLEQKQLKFYFTAPHRVDFRGLLKEMAHEFSTRIELEQIGPREAGSILGGIGRCGKELCCCRFLHEPGPVPMEVAQKQDLSISPERITGVCGRLLCCLKYECEDYERVLDSMPEPGSEIEYEDQVWEVVDRNVQLKTVTVRTEEENKVDLSLNELKGEGII